MKITIHERNLIVAFSFIIIVLIVSGCTTENKQTEKECYNGDTNGFYAAYSECISRTVPHIWSNEECGCLPILDDDGCMSGREVYPVTFTQTPPTKIIDPGNVGVKIHIECNAGNSDAKNVTDCDNYGGLYRYAIIPRGTYAKIENLTICWGDN